MKRLYILTFCSIVAAWVVAHLKVRPATTISAGNGIVVPRKWLHTNKAPLTPAKDVRPADQTFLTFPEWFLVFSPNEQAAYFTRHTATTFPFMAHTAQIWESYNIVSTQIKEDFPVNKGYHFMIWVIGSSASAEYSIKAWYETLIGRITDTKEVNTEEDRFNADFTKNYVDFIRDRPWYEYNFGQQLARLWTDVPLAGSNIIRKAERRYMLTSELLVKYGYGKLIGLGTKQIYNEALPTTAVLIDKDSLCYLHRYDRFAPEALALAEQGHTFREIAGNTSAILITVLVPAGNSIPAASTIKLFEQPVASDRTLKRVAIATPVANLANLLKLLNSRNAAIEHVFDF